MSQKEPSLKLKSVILQGAYRLRRHQWLGRSLAFWVSALLVAGGALMVFRSWPSLWPIVPWAALLLGFLACLAWPARHQYVHFEAISKEESLLQGENPAPPLRITEELPVRASGWFNVEGQDRYFVDLEADYKTTVSREHIILARVHPSHFLLFGRWPKRELGWWYIFLQPAAIRQVEVGILQVGLRPRTALRVTYSAGEDGPQAIYLTAGDATTLRRVWQDLLQDAPADVAAAVATG
jgi:hypothetical protein